MRQLHDEHKRNQDRLDLVPAALDFEREWVIAFGSKDSPAPPLPRNLTAALQRLFDDIAIIRVYGEHLYTDPLEYRSPQVNEYDYIP